MIAESGQGRAPSRRASRHRARGRAPGSGELAATVLSTFRLPYVQRLLPFLVPEFSVWSELDPSNLLAGRVDAIAIDDGKVMEVLDWKSDRDTALHRAAYIQQLRRYPSGNVGTAGRDHIHDDGRNRAGLALRVNHRRALLGC
jgi:hypothetical protein